jgi:hypothetical protein
MTGAWAADHLSLGITLHDRLTPLSDLRVFIGDHFYLAVHRQVVVRTLTQKLGMFPDWPACP